MEGIEEGVISVRPMSRVRLEQQHPVQEGVKDVHHYRDAFCVNNGAGVYGALAAGCAYVHTLSSGYSSTVWGIVRVMALRRMARDGVVKG